METDLADDLTPRLNDDSTGPGGDREDVPPVVDVAVIGSGLAGLAAARTAASAGCSVVVFEAGAVGGRARSTDRGGFRFNLGPRALYLGGAGQGVLDRLGVRRPGSAPLLSRAALLRDGELVVAPASPKGFISSPALGPAGKAQFGLFMGKLGLVKPAKITHLSMLDWLDRQSLRDDVQSVVLGITRLGTYCDDLDLLSADAGVTALQSSSRGVQYADGGWQSLVDQLAVGVEVWRRKVANVQSHKNVAEVHLVDGQIIRAHTVVVAVNSPAAAGSLLGQSLPPVGPPSLARCLTIGCVGEATPPVVIGLSDPLYLSMHSPPANLRVGERSTGSVVHLMRYVSRHDGPVDPHAGRAELLDLAARCGIAPETVVESEYLHSMSVVSAIATPALGGLPGRVRADAAGVDSVVLAGDFVGPTGLLADCSLVSGEAAGRHAAARHQNCR